MNRLAAILALLLPCLPLLAQKQAEPSADLGKAGADLASRFATELVKKAPKGKGEKLRVAVFPFGTNEGKYPLELGENGPILRGALVDVLRSLLDKKAPGKFAVLYPEQIDEQIKDSTTDPAGLSGKNVALSRKLLKSFNLQVGIIGRFGVKSVPTEIGFEDGRQPITFQPKFALPSVQIKATAILADSVIDVNGGVVEHEVKQHAMIRQPAVTQRLSVRFYAKVDEKRRDDDASAWKQIPLQVSTEKDTRGLFYLVVPKEYEGKRYKVVLLNHGKPEFYPNTKSKGADADRLFAATLMIDGVNSWMRQDGKEFRFVSGHPNTLTKWVLTAPGKRLVADKAGTKGRVEGGRLAPVSGTGHSEIHVLGFQKGSDVAGSFVFAKPVDSVAGPELLSSNKIGTISVYWTAERFVGDLGPAGGAGAGTKMGSDVSSPTFRVKVLNWYSRPVETWHIIYRYEGDPSLPRGLKLAE